MCSLQVSYGCTVWGTRGFYFLLRRLGKAIISALNPESRSSCLLSQLWRRFAISRKLCKRCRVVALMERAWLKNLQTVEWLPHADDEAGGGVSPCMVWSKCPVIKDLGTHAILHIKLLGGHKKQVVNPVVLHWINGRFGFVATFTGAGADGLCDSEWKVIGDPHVLALVVDDRTHVPNNSPGIACLVRLNFHSIFHLEVDCQNTVLRLVAVVTSRHISWEGLEASWIRLFSNQNLMRHRLSEVCTPHWTLARLVCFDRFAIWN
mmetsp:Transcript_22886/g.43874  ORF Transcript_22886/g.43874 Transcript_22886/m.43874 type:complete len:263 (-) Transcript_22886:230-1018(-)